MAGLDQMLQQRKAKDEHRQMMALLLSRQQPQPQGPAPYANQGGPMYIPPPVAQASPWSIVAAAFNGLAEGYKKSQQRDQQPTNEGAFSLFGGSGGMKG